MTKVTFNTTKVTQVATNIPNLKLRLAHFALRTRKQKYRLKKGTAIFFKFFILGGYYNIPG